VKMAYIKKRKHKFSTTYLATVQRRGFGIFNKSPAYKLVENKIKNRRALI
tara:strand:+ start:124 stop:273 length:150 start_codon:yes stop_codon:yes gene_type:complete